ncbi:MAG: replicative DNA helicase [Deltaproteobacteria bacterium CG23_combo_of_CG06-09_8_20_14_all_60_8]|nr:MAG: replicative DNA helicase [Desulfobacterales bacterium CG2_30_60_27]PIP43943.1 MAG: replicative DNA helicase [Deltaproteobacteria bacterium CG23_combo_of_CG06-09_8_20_14_all_60_8]
MEPSIQQLSASRRVPPQNLEAEQCVLGSILLQQGILVRAVEFLTPDDFYRDAHKAIYAAMLGLFDKGEPQDIITVTNHLKDSGHLEGAGGPAYLATLTNIVPVASNIAFYAKIVRAKSILRRLISTTTEIAGRCYEEQDDIDGLLDETEQTIFEISRAKSDQAFLPMSTIINDTFKMVEKLFERKELITGVSTGYPEFDRKTAGLQPSDLIIIAGRPSMGKTALAMNIAQNAAIERKVPVGVFSLEMSCEQLGMRMLCSVSRVDAQRLRTGSLQEHDWPKLTRAAGILHEAPLFIDDTPALSVLEMRAKARRLKTEHNIGLIVVDYLQLMRGRSSSERREQEISEISRSLKAMAKELHIPVIALSQLNRSLESRTDKRPQLSDLRESGAIEQDADLICFIYRDEVYNKSEDNPRRGTAEVIIGKQRNGPTGTIELTFLAQYTTFENPARPEYGERM